VSELKCFFCLVAYETRASEEVRSAEYVYDGKSMCGRHVNSWRGLSEDFDRYPKPEDS
jgi:hypothetical protein